MAEVFEVEDSDFGGGSGHHGSVFSKEMGAPTPRIRGKSMLSGGLRGEPGKTSSWDNLMLE